MCFDRAPGKMVPVNSLYEAWLDTFNFDKLRGCPMNTIYFLEPLKKVL